MIAVVQGKALLHCTAGDAIAKLMGGNGNPFLQAPLFYLPTSACATLTGARIGSLFILAPITIASC